jgi:hypothetical protein
MRRRSAKHDQSEQKPKRKKCRRCRRKLLFLLLAGGAAALILSEDLRNRALDLLFGSEEQFNYTPPQPPNGESTAHAA